VESIEAAIEYVEFRIRKTNEKRKFGKFEKLTNDQIKELFSSKFEKSNYLKYLAEIHSKEYRLIPIIEYQNKQLEESFIFRLQTLSKRILIAWENSKVGRATHLFIAEEDSMAKRIISIESFIMDTVDAKRSHLHANDAVSRKIKTELMYIGSINHDDLTRYKNEMRHYINRY
jgi:hypothetical protein